MILNGGLSTDDRGTVTYFNDFDFKDIKRFYVVQNHEKGFTRAWHGHKKEAKYAFVVRGAVKLAVVKMEDEKTAATHILSAQKPQILCIPPGYYNGFRTLTDDAQIIFFSTTSIEEAEGDDYRKPADTWDLLRVEER